MILSKILIDRRIFFKITVLLKETAYLTYLFSFFIIILINNGEESKVQIAQGVNGVEKEDKNSKATSKEYGRVLNCF